MLNLDRCEDVELFLENVHLDISLGSFHLAKAAVRLFKKLIIENSFESEKSLMSSIEKVSKRLYSTYPNEPSFENIATKFLRAFEEECKKSVKKGAVPSEQESLDFMKIAEGVISDLVTEVDSSREGIAAKGLDIIRPTDVILTCGDSKTVEVFLKHARRNGDFTVWVIGETRKNREDMVDRLRGHGIQAHRASEESVYFLMSSSVTKVVVGAREVASGSGLVCDAGICNVATASSLYCVPVIACVPSFKFSNRQLCQAEMEGDVLVSPGDIVPYDEKDKMSEVKVLNHLCNFVPMELVERIVSN